MTESTDQIEQNEVFSRVLKESIYGAKLDNQVDLTYCKQLIDQIIIKKVSKD
jgi:hypothetical protein